MDESIFTTSEEAAIDGALDRVLSRYTAPLDPVHFHSVLVELRHELHGVALVERVYRTGEETAPYQISLIMNRLPTSIP